jgi:hypothetical protein
LTLEASAFIKALLEKDHRLRLGTKSDQEVLLAPFFRGVDWGAMERKETQPAFEPASTAPDDSDQALEEYFRQTMEQEPVETPVSPIEGLIQMTAMKPPSFSGSVFL